MDGPEMTLGTLPQTTPAAEGEAPVPGAPEAEEERASRRKKAILLLLLLLLLVLVALSTWYLLFRKPVTEIPLPVAPATMPSYQGSLYQLSKPQDVAVSADGSRIYITQTGTTLDTVVMDLSGKQLAVLAPPTDLIPQPHQLFVAIDPLTGEIWTTDRFNGAVAVYSAAGSFERIFDQGVVRQYWQPLAIAFDKAGDLFIADVSSPNAVIDVFDPEGKFIRAFGQNDSLDHPNGIAIATNGDVYVADTGNGQLIVYDGSGTKIGVVGRGVGTGDLGMPVGVAFDDQGRVAVVDSAAGTVQVYAPMAAGDTRPAYLGSFAEDGSADAQLKFPNGLAADGRGRLFVADWGNDRLQIWSY
jgi:DNA-binding beta-propeller fold protein YncE